MYIRIEHPTDEKGFCRTKLYDVLILKQNNSMLDFYDNYFTNFPTPLNESLDICSDEYCAFRSKKIFRKFCKKEHLEFFINKGFKIYQITPKDSKKIKRGKFQILFQKEHVIYKDITEQYV